MSSNYCLRVGLISHPFSLGIIETPVSSPYHLHLSYLHFFFPGENPANAPITCHNKELQ